MPRTHRALVEKGFRFTNSFITNAWCCPSRASILSGQYSHTNGVWTVGGPYGMKAWLAHEESTLATWLHDAGYRTGIVGKYLNEYGAAHIPAYAPPGWDTTAIMTNLVYSVNPGYFDYRLFEDGDLVHYGRQDEDYSTRVFTRKARNFIAPGGDRPWLLYLAYTSPPVRRSTTPRTRTPRRTSPIGGRRTSARRTCRTSPGSSAASSRAG